MPSRGKKALRDSKITNDFFNQTEAFVCPCCNNRIQSHAIRAMKPGESSDHNLPEAKLDEGTADSVMSFLKEKLTSEEHHKWQSLHDIQNEAPNLEGVSQALKLAHTQMNDASPVADQSTPMDTFDLGNLEEVAKKSEVLYKMYKDDEEREMAEIAEKVRNLAVTASDEKRSSDDRLAANLDILNLDIRSKITVPLTSCLRQVQLFNMDKKFGFLEKGLQTLTHDEKKGSGEDVPAELPLAFRQKLNNPFKLMESVPKQSKKKNKKERSLDDTLVRFQQNLQLMTKEFQEHKKTVSDAEKPIKLPSPPSTFTYAGVPVPEGIADHIHQRLFDGAFALRQVAVLQKEASKQRDDAQRTLTTWYTAGRETWEAGKARIHEMPLFREYEYTRKSLHAMYLVASRQEVKIVEFYSSEGAPKLPEAIKNAFRLGELCPEGFEKRSEVWCHKLLEQFPSIDQMMIGIDGCLKIGAELRKRLDGSTQ